MNAFQLVGLSLPHQPRMRHVMAALLLAAMLLGSMACSTVSSARSQKDSTENGAVEPPLSQDLEEGRTLYERRCGTCHELYAPQEYSRASWPRYVKRYGPRSGLTPADREKVTAYLQATAVR